jgi:EAL domain-containing protein (putative c-di-GMP-specific phosphodiesterase class I)
VFEVTEGVIMHHQDVAADFMRDLRAEGVELHVDDFGTGHSSLSSLHELPVDALKIDRSFVARMQSSQRSRELVGIMVTMGARFGLDVIAEGIETEDEAAALAELECPLVQGYLFSRPVPASEATTLLLAQASVGAGVPRQR